MGLFIRISGITENGGQMSVGKTQTKTNEQKTLLSKQKQNVSQYLL